MVGLCSVNYLNEALLGAEWGRVAIVGQGRRNRYNMAIMSRSNKKPQT